MNMKVVFMDNREGIIDAALLDEMISVNMIRMFMRSDGWAMVGINPIRGAGGTYDGMDRRGTYSLPEHAAYKIVA